MPHDSDQRRRRAEIGQYRIMPNDLVIDAKRERKQHQTYSKPFSKPCCGSHRNCAIKHPHKKTGRASSRLCWKGSIAPSVSFC